MPEHSTAVDNGSADFRRLDVGAFRVTDVTFPAGLVLSSHAHPRACLAVILDGSVEKTFPSGERTLCAPAAVSMPPEERHVDRFERGGARIVVVEPAVPDDDAFGRGGAVFTRVHELRDGLMQSLAWRIHAELSHPDAVTPLAVDGLARQLVACAARSPAPTPAGGRPPRWFVAAEELLRQRFAEPLRVADLARFAGVHPAHFAKVFRAHGGASLGATVRRLRLEWAARQLSSDDQSLCDIAAHAGFADQSHFTRAFRRWAGIPPGDYRRLASGRPRVRRARTTDCP